MFSFLLVTETKNQGKPFYFLSMQNQTVKDYYQHLCYPLHYSTVVLPEIVSWEVACSLCLVVSAVCSCVGEWHGSVGLHWQWGWLLVMRVVFQDAVFSVCKVACVWGDSARFQDGWSCNPSSHLFRTFGRHYISIASCAMRVCKCCGALMLWGFCWSWYFIM